MQLLLFCNLDNGAGNAGLSAGNANNGLGNANWNIGGWNSEIRTNIYCIVRRSRKTAAGGARNAVPTLRGKLNG